MPVFAFRFSSLALTIVSASPPVGADYGWGAVLQAVELVQPARLVAARHQKQVAAGLDQVRQRLVEAEVQADFCGVLPLELQQLVVVLGVALAKKDEPAAEVEEAGGGIKIRSIPFCDTSRAMTPRTGRSSSTGRPK